MRRRESKPLAEGEIHVYCAELDEPDSRIQELQSLLAPDEQQRAGRFRFEPDKKRFIAARGILRTILSEYLSISPASLEFEYGTHGKPALRAHSVTRPLRFSLSHSRGVAVYALTSNREIGVDVERIRSVPDADRIVQRYFTAAESAIYHSVAPLEKEEIFFNLWTCKEAYLKAIGVGLSGSLRSVEVSIAPGEVPKLLMSERDEAKAGCWSLRLFRPAPGHVAALAVEGSSEQLRFWKLCKTGEFVSFYNDASPG